jgi:hypothetical protein
MGHAQRTQAVCRETVTPKAGHKLNFMMTATVTLTDAEYRLESLMLAHWSDDGCWPSLERLMKITGWTKAKTRRVRDSLAAKGRIGFVSGTGRDSTRYRLKAAEEWWNQHPSRVPARAAPCVPESAVEGAGQSGTESLEPIIESSGGAPGTAAAPPSAPPEGKVVDMTPRKGWVGLLAQADPQIRKFWLDAGFVVSDGPDGLVVRFDKSLHREKVTRMLEPGGELHALAVRCGINTSKVLIQGPACSTAPPPPDSVRDGDSDGFDPSRSRGKRLKEWDRRMCDKADTNDLRRPAEIIQLRPRKDDQ